MRTYLLLLAISLSLSGCSSEEQEKLEDLEGDRDTKIAEVSKVEEDDNRAVTIDGYTLITIDDTDLYEMDEVNVNDYFSAKNKDNKELEVNWDWDSQDIDRPGNYFVNVFSEDDLGNKENIEIQVKIIDRSGYDWGYYTSPS